MTKKKIPHPRTGTKPAFRLPDERVKDALDTLDRALLITIANTCGREGSGTDSHNLAVAAKAAVDLRSMLLLGGAS